MLCPFAPGAWAKNVAASLEKGKASLVKMALRHVAPHKYGLCDAKVKAKKIHCVEINKKWKH